MFYSATQVHVAGGANEALYPVRQDGFDNSTQNSEQHRDQRDTKSQP